MQLNGGWTWFVSDGFTEDRGYACTEAGARLKVLERIRAIRKHRDERTMKRTSLRSGKRQPGFKDCSYGGKW